MSSRSYGQFCALAQALDRVGDRWTLLIIRELVPAPARFRDLSEALPGLASNLLTQRLRGLEADGLVVQRVLEPPAGVNVYELTDQGRELEPVLRALAQWGTRFMPSASYTEPAGPRSLVTGLRLLLPQRIQAGRPASIGLLVGGHGIGITVSDKGAVLVTLGALPSPEATLELSYRHAFALMGGKLTVRRGVELGHIKAKGSAGALAVLDELLDAQPEPTPLD